jgi:hypothetical protein
VAALNGVPGARTGVLPADMAGAAARTLSPYSGIETLFLLNLSAFNNERCLPFHLKMEHYWGSIQ